MTYKGIVKSNVVVLEEGITLPEGAQVEILLLDMPPRTPSDLDLKKRYTALNRLLSLQLPIADWEKMEEEIIKGAME